MIDYHDDDDADVNVGGCYVDKQTAQSSLKKAFSISLMFVMRERFRKIERKNNYFFILFWVGGCFFLSLVKKR